MVELKLKVDILFVGEVWLRAVEPSILIDLLVLESVHVVEDDNVLEGVWEVRCLDPNTTHSALSWLELFMLLLFLVWVSLITIGSCGIVQISHLLLFIDFFHLSVYKFGTINCIK